MRAAALSIIVAFTASTSALAQEAPPLETGQRVRVTAPTLDIDNQQEMRFDFNQPAPFEGLEGEGRLRIDPRALRASYLEALKAHNKTIANTALGFGFDYHRLDTHESVGPALTYLLARRNSFIKRSKVG